MSSEDVLHLGSCHCGEVTFEVLAPEVVTVFKCNCSICLMKQNHHFIVPGNKFRILTGEDKLTTYRFNTRVAKHTFCSVCGVQSFYTPRSNPDGKGISPYSIKGGTLKEVRYEGFDGTNWEQEMTSRKEYMKSLSAAK